MAMATLLAVPAVAALRWCCVRLPPGARLNVGAALLCLLAAAVLFQARPRGQSLPAVDDFNII